MNEANYASLEASKRLVDAGIVLETEAVWRKKRDKTGYYLSRKALYHRTSDIPAPSMAEAWRELPEHVLRKSPNGTAVAFTQADALVGTYSSMQRNTNPTDALIDLLIWQRSETTRL